MAQLAHAQFIKTAQVEVGSWARLRKVFGSGLEMSLFDGANISARQSKQDLVQPFTARFHNALALDLSHKCWEIWCLIQEGSQRDLQTIFPILIDNIFGVNYQYDWGLKSLSKRQNYQDFKWLRQFLSPTGPIFHLIYRLVSDSSIKFDFPVSYLPAPSKRALEEGVIPVIYVNKLHLHQISGRMPTVISLNAFEYYMFHFAYFLVNPYNLKIISNWTTPGEAVYPTVVDDYLSYFFPTSGNVIQPVNISPIQRPSIPVQSNVAFPYFAVHSTPNQSFRLLKNQHILKNSVTTPVKLAESSQMETWRTEIMAQIFTEMWLTQNTVENSNINAMIQAQDPFMVNFDHMRVVRMLIKHFHYFANSYSIGSMDPLEELKRSIMSQLFQKKFYTFLQYSIANWPLDASFRLVLETWLSYIQPWRYLSTESEREIILDNSWQRFVLENLCFYTVVFQRILPRFLRMDLSTPKNSYMLYRITKVYSQPYLVELIQKAEMNLVKPSNRLADLSMSFPDDSSSFSSQIATGMVAAVRQQLFELERPGFQYVSLFSEEMRVPVQQLLLLIRQARSTVQEMFLTMQTNGSSYLTKVRSFLTSVFDANHYPEDLLPQDNRKVHFYLSSAYEQLAFIFKLNSPPLDDSVERQPEGTPESITQNRKNITFQGNPDLQPIRSFEITFLVRFFYNIASALNEKYHTELRRYYHRRDFVGNVCKQFLAGPVIYYEYDKTTFPVTRIQKVLPPRFNFRPFANKQLIGYVCSFLLISWVWGYNPALVILLSIGLILSLVAAKAGYESRYPERLNLPSS